MEERYNFEEFYCAANSSQPVHISSYHSEEISTIAPICPRKVSLQQKDNTRPSIKSSNGSLKQLKQKVISGAACPFTSNGTSTKEHDSNDTEATRKSSFFLPKKPGDMGMTTEEERKELLTGFLSPSPFRNEDPNKREVRLDHLITSAPCPTKKIIFSPFYGSEMMGEQGHRAWKIALKDHIVHTFESISLIKKLSPVPLQIIENKKQVIESLNSSIFFGFILGKKLLIFDLDETLVHCVTDNIKRADHAITVTLNTGEQIAAGVYIRPYAVECLRELKEYYDLIVFTASEPSYANIVIDILDPDHKLFSARLFRKSCIKTDIGLYIKDLRVINCDLKSTLIVDNSIFSFAFQLDNGVPMIPFYDDKEDRIMLKIKDYLINLKDLEDVTTINRKIFSLTELYELDISPILRYYYDDEEQEENPEDVKNTDEGKDKQEVKTIMPASKCATNPFKIRTKAQRQVDDHLGKFRVSFGKYLARKERSKETINNQ